MMNMAGKDCSSFIVREQLWAARDASKLIILMFKPIYTGDLCESYIWMWLLRIRLCSHRNALEMERLTYHRDLHHTRICIDHGQVALTHHGIEQELSVRVTAAVVRPVSGKKRRDYAIANEKLKTRAKREQSVTM